jgi:ATP-dependent RNA helicase DDX27
VVLNYSTPQTHEIYLHRVGRTARAGRTGHACTLAAEPDRKVVRAAVKAAKAQGAKVVSRTIPNDEVARWDKKLRELEEDVVEVLAEEKEEKALSTAERDLTKSENLVKYEKEIMSRPKRTWFETEKDKKQAKLKGMIELNGEEALSGKKKEKKKKLSGKEKKKLEERDIRREGKVWKKGKEERAGKGVLAEAKKGKTGKGSATKGKPRKMAGRRK